MVDRAVGLEPSRVALFGYAHVPWMKAHQKLIDEALLPGPAERLQQFSAASRRLCEHGFRPVGLDHFARPSDDLAAALTSRPSASQFPGLYH